MCVCVCVCVCVQLASDAGALVSMTESEKKRLEELLCEDNELDVSERNVVTCDN